MQPGMTVGPYRILEQVGLGGMATVFKAYDPGTDRYVAIKIVSPQFAQHPEFRERFRREAKSIANLEHPHIIPVHAFGEEGETAYLVLRYMDTGTLRDLMDHQPMELDQAGRLIRQVAGALDYAHRNGVIHRDVKPSNILIDSEGNAYLTDFGIAKIVEATIELTGTGTAMGTPQYMSPEQCRGEKDLTPATDIYSLGVMFYQMLTGHLPFDADTPLAVLHKHLHDPLPPPRKINPQLSEEMERVLLKVLAKDPGDRYSSASELAAAVREAMRQPSPAKPAPAKVEKTSTMEGSALLKSGLRRFWWAGALLLVGLGSVAVLGLPRLAPPAVATEPAEQEPATSAVVFAEPQDPVVPELDRGIDCMGSSPGDEIYLWHPWGEDREEHLRSGIQPLLNKCGLVLVGDNLGDPDTLGQRLLSADRPNVMIWDGMGSLKHYIQSMTPLELSGGDPGNYPDYWIELGSAQAGNAGSKQWLAVPLAVGLKSLIWYSPEDFDSYGYQVPEDFGQLEALVEQMAADGNVPWAMGLESGNVSGWVGSDFIQDLLLNQSGSDYVNGIINGSVAYDSAEVLSAYEQYLHWAADPRYTVGGTDGTLNINFHDAVLQPFLDPPEAMMVYQAGWAGGDINSRLPSVSFEESIDFFPFPGSRVLQGNAEWMTLLEPTPAAEALVSFLTSARGATSLASQDFGITPNFHVQDEHTDSYLAKQRSILEHAQAFSNDLGDTIGGEFAHAEWQAIVDVLSGADLQSALQAASEAQARTLAGR